MASFERWQSTWLGLGASTPAERPYEEIVVRYSEPQRRYHTVQHLDECFARLDEARHCADRIHEVELALWFHDAVYDVRRHDNEEQSARLAQSVTSQAGVVAAVIGRIHTLIMATKHDALPGSPDAALIVDVDLSILGAPPERFDEYERQVREEYSWVPGFVFRSKRREILQSFLARPSVFNTEHFRARLEAAARANLERSIAGLSG